MRPQDNFYKFVNGEQLRSATFIPGYQQFSDSVVMQHKVYKQLASLEYNPNSAFCKTLHAKVSNLPTHSDGTCLRTLNQILQMDSVDQIAEMFGVMQQNGCVLFFTLHTNPDFEAPYEILYFEEREPHSMSESYISFLCKSFQIEPMCAKRSNDFARKIFQFAYTPTQRKDVKLCYNPRVPPNWVKMFLGCFSCKTINFDNPKTYQTIQDMMSLEHLAEWRNMLAVYWMDHCAALFRNTYRRNLVMHGDVNEETTRKLHFTQLASAAWWQDAGDQYATHFVSRSSLKIASILIDLVFQQFVHHIQLAPWTEKTRNGALEKLVHMKVHIGSRDHSSASAAARVSDVASFDECYFAGHRHQFEITMTRCDTIVNPRTWREMGFHIVNAFYITELNLASFPAAILADLDEANATSVFANHARVIAHEMAHAFDSQGRKCNFDGKLVNWWSRSDTKEYNRNLVKLAKLYAKVGIDPELTMTENVADVVSLHVAYKLWLKPEASDQEKKQFFIEYAASQICKTTSSFHKESLSNDTHSHAEARTNVPLSCIKDFQTVFNIKPGDKMYIAECDIPYFL